MIKIFKIIGTPTAKQWPEMRELKNYNEAIPNFKGIGIKKHVLLQMKGKKDKICEKGLDLLEKMLLPNPLMRITAKEAMEHPWFDCFREQKKGMETE